MLGPLRSVLTALVSLLIRFYQVAISPMFPANCRFQPTCSEYTLQAVKLHGPIRGLWLGAKRIGKCHPLHAGGYDPVPKTENLKPKT
jgi:hypothetical protein